MYLSCHLLGRRNCHHFRLRRIESARIWDQDQKQNLTKYTISLSDRLTPAIGRNPEDVIDLHKEEIDNDQCTEETRDSSYLLLSLYNHLSKTVVSGRPLVLWMNKSKRTNKELLQSMLPREIRWTSKRLCRRQIPTLTFLPGAKSRPYRSPNRLHLGIITSHQSMPTIISLYKRKQSITKAK